jgi:hypothetical protein
VRSTIAGCRALIASDGALIALTAFALLLGIGRRALIGWDQPLNLDETWTAAIAARPDIATLLTRCLHELSGPVFYGSEWLWVKLAGASNLALRVPGIAWAIATPLLILFAGHPHHQTRLLWAGLAATWVPATLFAPIARSYSLLILLATMQLIALTRLLRQPNQRDAWLWAGLSGLLILTHYHALILTGLQGLLILARGKPAWRCWPALLAFVPVAAWMSIHIPLVLHFADPNVAWFNLFGWRQLASIVPAAMFGLAPFGMAILATAFVTTAWGLSRYAPRDMAERLRSWDAAAVLPGIIAILIVATMATMRPSFSPRYIIPFMPGILFGLSIWALALNRRWPGVAAVLLGLFVLLALAEAKQAVTAPPPDWRHNESLEGASRFIATARPTRLILFLDGPSATPGNEAMTDEVGGFFLRRAGLPVSVETLTLPRPHVDANRALLAAASGPRDAILWVYNRSLRNTRGVEFPPSIDRRDPRWHCRDYGAGTLSVIACVQPPARPVE